MKLSNYVMDYLASVGVEHVFMLPGGGAMHLVDSLGRHPSLKCICNLHEQGLAIAVDAYAQVKGFGVGLVTSGPGGTNTITGVAAAWLDSTPCLFISGQVKTSDMRKSDGPRQLGFQEIDIVSLVKPITKYAVTITDPSSITYHLDKAIHEAKSGRPGPVWIDIPLDIQAAEINPNAQCQTCFVTLPPCDSLDLIDMYDSLSRAKRPIIMLGNGIRSAFQRDDFSKFNIPLLLTWKAADLLDENDLLNAGRPGILGQRAANWVQQECDWFLSIGARLDMGQTAYQPEHFAPNARKYIVDIDQTELNKLNLSNAYYIKSDAENFIKIFKQYFDDMPFTSWAEWIAQIADWKKKYPVIQSDYYHQLGINPYCLIDILSDHLGDGDILVPGSSGACSELVHQAWRVNHGLRMFNSQGLGSMGFGVPAALGACIASGGKRTICIEGDGGFQMNLQELEVIRRLNLPIKFFILDNNGYGSIRNMQKTHFQENYVGCDANSGLSLPNIVKVCQGYGIGTWSEKYTVCLNLTCANVLNSDGPQVCVIQTQQNHIIQPKCMSKKLPNGKMETCPMEDMWPYVERESNV